MLKYFTRLKSKKKQYVAVQPVPNVCTRINHWATAERSRYDVLD